MAPAPTSGRSTPTNRAGLHELVDHLFRYESGRLSASLVAVFGPSKLDLIEDVVQEALVEALRHWRFNGVPENPAAWLTQVARRRALDALRRDATLRRHEPKLRAWAERNAYTRVQGELDEQLRLMLMCCHPGLPREQRVALTLKLVAGLGTGEIARAFLITESAAAQRLVRAKKVIRENGISMDMPEAGELRPRLRSVLETVYLLFNEGYAAGEGDQVVRRDRLEEACRLGAMLVQDERTASPSAHALLALMLFHASRLDTRSDADGALLLLEDQPRQDWDQGLIARGFHHLQRAAGGDELTAYHLEAGIAAIHARAIGFDETNWDEIVALYDLLLEQKPGPVVGLNRAVAIAMAHGATAGLAELDAIGPMGGYPHHAIVRGELLRRAERTSEAREQLARALAMPCSEPQRAFVERKIAALGES
ncbi:MAG: sigma-70 family RNA polymerase sigma factor [Phycisphaera sp.]|nr:MAG: sigma-70 family RNA polymerase sigma factor [Phycisphaera sp.]